MSLDQGKCRDAATSPYRDDYNGVFERREDHADVVGDAVLREKER